MDADSNFCSSSVEVLPGVVTERDEARLGGVFSKCLHRCLLGPGICKSERRFSALFTRSRFNYLGEGNRFPISSDGVVLISPNRKCLLQIREFSVISFCQT